MSIVEGVVAVKMPSKFDDSIRVKLEDGDWYSADQDMADGIRKGATVKLKTQKRGRNVVIEKVKELSPPAEGSSGGGGGRRGGGGGGGRYQPDPKRENSIHYQSARKDALTFLQLQQEAGILKLGTKAAEKLNKLHDELDILTEKFYTDIGELGAVKRIQDQADESEDFDPDEEGEQDDDF